jgi:hypothetical protein
MLHSHRRENLKSYMMLNLVPNIKGGTKTEGVREQIAENIWAKVG